MNTFRRLLLCLLALLLAVMPALAEYTLPPLAPAAEDYIPEGEAEAYDIDLEVEKKVNAILSPEEIKTNNYYGALVSYDDTPYALNDGTELLVYDGTKMQPLRRVTEEKQTQEEQEDDYLYFYILEGDDSLYMLTGDNGLLYKVILSGDTYSLSEYARLNWEGMTVNADYGDDYFGTRYICSGAVKGGIVYLLAENDNYEYALYKFDIANGTYDSIPLSGIYCTDVKAYRDGLVLLSYNGLYYLDLKTDELNVLFANDNSTGMAIDKDGHLYVCANGEIYSDRNNGQFEVVGYTSMTSGYYDSQSAAIYGDYGYMRLAYDNSDGVELCDTAPGTMPEFVLRIANSSTDLSAAITAFNQLYPGVPVVIDYSGYASTAQGISEMMQGSKPADLYGLSLRNIDLSALAKKDYLLALDMDDYAASLNERIRDVCSYNGTLYAVPTYTFCSTLGYSTRTLEKLGLTEDDIPKTYSQLLDFINRWQSEFASEYPEISLFSDMKWIDMKSNLVASILDCRELQCRLAGETLSFKDAALQETLEKLSQTDFYGFYDPNDDTGNDDDVYYMDYVDGVPNFLFTAYYSITPSTYSNDEGFKPFTLTISEDDQPLTKMWTYAVAVNPDTQHMEAALALLRCIAENIDDVQKIIMMPAQNEPIKNTWAMEPLSYNQRVVSELTALRDTLTKEMEIRYVQQFIDDYTSNTEYYERHLYMASAESIAAYRALESQLVPAYVSSLSSSEEVLSLMNRLRDGDIDARTFLNELDRKVQMILLEGD